jgi:hypothetical protein|tara:strand:+ start:994 stop:1197 length:204 start_codon:yes stop_codon:yes gene_type:complete
MAGLVLARREHKEVLREEAIERNKAYQKQISTPEGIQQYIALTPSIGEKQMTKLNALTIKLKKHKKK